MVSTSPGLPNRRRETRPVAGLKNVTSGGPAIGQTLVTSPEILLLISTRVDIIAGNVKADLWNDRWSENRGAPDEGTFQWVAAPRSRRRAQPAPSSELAPMPEEQPLGGGIGDTPARPPRQVDRYMLGDRSIRKAGSVGASPSSPMQAAIARLDRATITAPFGVARRS